MNKLMLIQAIIKRLTRAYINKSLAVGYERRYDIAHENSDHEEANECIVASAGHLQLMVKYQTAADLLTLALLAQSDRSDTPAQPAKSAGARLVVDVATDRYAQQRRQEARESNGRYAKMHECEGCGKRIGADYCSDPRVNTVFHGDGLILCGRCSEHMDTLSDTDALDFMANKRGKELKRKPRQSHKTSPKSSATGKPVSIATQRPTDWILKAQIDAAFDELVWRKQASCGTWLDLHFGEIE